MHRLEKKHPVSVHSDTNIISQSSPLIASDIAGTEKSQLSPSSPASPSSSTTTTFDTHRRLSSAVSSPFMPSSECSISPSQLVTSSASPASNTTESGTLAPTIDSALQEDYNLTFEAALVSALATTRTHSPTPYPSPRSKTTTPERTLLSPASLYSYNSVTTQTVKKSFRKHNYQKRTAAELDAIRRREAEDRALEEEIMIELQLEQERMFREAAYGYHRRMDLRGHRF